MPERFQDENELIGGSRKCIDYLSGDGMLSTESDLTSAVLKGIVETQALIQQEVRKTSEAMHEIALTLKEVSVRIEPLTVLQSSVNMHEGRITRIEADQTNTKEQHERAFRITLTIFSSIIGLLASLVVYMLTHVKFS